ncbi:threonine ammonia-lyase [Achromobacter pestifer]|uniref:L-threonine dehydratase catabolic TdcB n=1 Tax=Achromobacter pestifer TaxID=1353889 RepID=A0A6S6ZJU6_9BURK|nr:threonine/serine dehydratase [Achromobacter pestifer]CAB3627676.1 L-threonine dehydratase catabolic TdcB [Achromobacter pestifer]
MNAHPPVASCLPTFRDVEAAARHVSRYCIETPLLESPYLNQQYGGRLLVKAENLQVTGSFKLRGAANRMRVLTDEERRRGIVARSSGNHGLAVAYCAGLMGISAVVVVPDTAPAAKIERIAAYGARVVAVPMKDLANVAADVTQRENRVLVPPADDFWVVAGAGTVALEMVTQAAAMRARIDVLLTCCSGGGLTAGCLLGLSETSPATQVYGVEAAGFEKMAHSLAAGQCVDLPAGGQSICDAISGLYMAKLPFDIIKPRLAGTFAVTDEQAKAAMRVAFSEFGLAIEPGAAVALAAVLTHKMPLDGRTIAVTLSGRNTDLNLAGAALQEPRTTARRA